MLTSLTANGHCKGYLLKAFKYVTSMYCTSPYREDDRMRYLIALLVFVAGFAAGAVISNFDGPGWLFSGVGTLLCVLILPRGFKKNRSSQCESQ